MRFTHQSESPTDRETHELLEPGLIVCLCRLKEVTPDKIPQVRPALQQGYKFTTINLTPPCFTFTLQTFSEFWKNDVRQARKGKYR